jgi:SNF2 family DNA or RNA helicase
MLAPVSLRRTKSEFWKDMPAFLVTEVAIDGDTEEIRRLILEHPGLEEAIKEAARQGGLSELDAPHIATLRRLVGVAKAPAFCDLLDEKLRSGLDKAVVMGVHTQALQIIYDAMVLKGHKPVMIRGDTSTAARKAAVETFQGDPSCRVFIGNIKAAGTGLTLTAAAEIFMVEQSWSPADNAQALMRVHRIGQTRNVVGTFVALANSVDEDVVDILATKTTNITAIDPTAFQMTA